MKGRIAVILTICLFITLGFASADSFIRDYEPPISETASDFYVLMSKGNFAMMRTMLTDELTERLMNADRTPRPERLVRLLSMADDVSDKKIKVVLLGENVRVRSLDGGTVEVKIRYSYRITDAESGKTRTYSGNDVMIMKRPMGQWLIDDIRNMNEVVR